METLKCFLNMCACKCQIGLYDFMRLLVVQRLAMP
jgi:hypothetical protein